MPRQSALRAADRDREAVAERLRHAAVEGRLEPEELEERLHVALRARTYGELQRLLADLPRPPVRRALPVVRIAFAVALMLAVVAAVMVVAAVLIAGWMAWAFLWLALCLRRRSRSASRPRRTPRRTGRWPTSAGGPLVRDPWRA